MGNTIELVRAWIVLTFMRIIDALGWPWWLLLLIGLVVVPIAAVRTYYWLLKRILEASE